MKKTLRMLGVLVLGLQLLNSQALARNAPDAMPPCLDERGNTLGVDNADAVLWKTTTPNQTLKRGHIAGIISKLYPDHNGHTHFEAKLGPSANETIEVIYNMSFGQINGLSVGQTVEACGDYITSTAPAGGYVASPDGAIIHWIHMNPGRGHESGFLMIEGTVFGQNLPAGGPPNHPPRGGRHHHNRNFNDSPFAPTAAFNGG